MLLEDGRQKLTSSTTGFRSHAEFMSQLTKDEIKYVALLAFAHIHREPIQNQYKARVMLSCQSCPASRDAHRPVSTFAVRTGGRGAAGCLSIAHHFRASLLMFSGSAR
jgi:hypothetical protein